MALFQRHPKGTPFKVSLEHFPEATRHLIPTEMMQRLGVLALGYRGKSVLNVGLLDLTKREHLKEVERELRTLLPNDGVSFRFYRVSQEDFDRVLGTLYGIPPSTTSQSSART